MSQSERLTPQRLLEAVLSSICAESNIRLSSLCSGWVLRLERADRARHVYGYQFDLNAAAAAAIAHDKHATASLLAQAGIAAVPHVLFAEGAGTAMADYVAGHGHDIVCKPNLASGGERVSRVSSASELMAGTQALFDRGHRAVCLSPYLEIADEYRVVLLDQQPLLLYRKQRPAVRGDGRLSLAELAARDHPGLLLDPAVATAAARIPAAGEQVLLSWRHNLALGARAEPVDPAVAPRLIALAVAASRALGLRLAAVDLVDLADRDENIPPVSLAVLEVNPGIMLDHFARQGANETARARQVYQRIVATLMAEP